MSGPAFIETTRAHLAEHGWAKFHVRRVKDDPLSPIAFTYTVGLDVAFGLPELIVCGLTEDTINAMIGKVIDALVAAGGWRGQSQRLDGILRNLPVELREIDASFLGSVFAHNILFRKSQNLPPLAGAVQIFWPGPDGLFPWDAGHADAFDDQPRLDVPGRAGSAA
jgi:Domain of unknown function (DUF4262)